MKAKGLTIKLAGGNEFERTLPLLTTIRLYSSELSSLSNKTLDVHFHERAFETNQPIGALAATLTKFGMTSKSIIGQSRLPVVFRP